MSRSLIVAALVILGAQANAQSIVTPRTLSPGSQTGGLSSSCLTDPAGCTLPRASPQWKFNPGAGSGVGGLTVDVYGTSKLTTVTLCDAKTTTATTWPCTVGGTFTEAVGTPTEGLAAPLTDVNARSEFYAGTQDHQAPDTTTGEVATEDLVARILVNVKARAAVQQIVGKYDTGGSLGWKIGVDNTDHINATVNATTIADAATIDGFGEWDILALYCRHDGSAGSMRLYKNGYSVATGVCPAATSAAATKHLTFAAQSDNAGAQSIIGWIAFVKVATCTACMGTNAAMDAQEQEHAQEIMAVWPSSAVVAAPLTTDLRATVAAIDIDRDGDGIVREFRVGSKWLRVARRCDTTRGYIGEGCLYYNGYLAEDPGVQMLVQSTDMSTTWTKLNAADTTLTNRVGGPEYNGGALTADALQCAADGVGTEHGWRQTSATLTNGQKYTFSAWSMYETAVGAQKQFMWLRDKTIGDTATAWFDRFSCQIASVGTGVFSNSNPPMRGITQTRSSARATFWGTDSFSVTVLCRFEVDITGTAATHNFDIGFSDVAGTLTSTTGAGNIVGDVWGAQVEATRPGHRASSPIWSGTVAGQRNADGLRFDIANYPSAGGTLTYEIFDPYTSLGSTQLTHSVCTPFLDINNHVLFKTTQSTGNGQRGPAYTSMAGGGFYAEIPNGGVEQLNCCGNGASFGQYATPASGSSHDGRYHHARLVFFPNDVRGYFDGDPVFGIGDTSVSLPNLAGGGIDVGYSSADQLQHGDGLIVSCALYTGEVTPVYPRRPPRRRRRRRVSFHFASGDDDPRIVRRAA